MEAEVLSVAQSYNMAAVEKSQKGHVEEGTIRKFAETLADVPPEILGEFLASLDEKGLEYKRPR